MMVSRYGDSAYYTLGPIRLSLYRGSVTRPGFSVGWYRSSGKIDWDFSLFGTERKR